MLKSKGLSTDLLLSKHVSRVTEFDDHIVVDTPGNPKYFWGNYLIFKGSPQQDLISHYVNCFEEYFKDNPEIGHIALTWDDTNCIMSVELAAKFEEFGFEVDPTIVMTAQDISLIPKEYSDIHIRKITSNLDWKKVLQLQSIMRDEFDRDKIYNMLEKRFEHYRELIKSKHGEWFGAFQDDKLVGDLGIIFDNYVARFQNVETHPDYIQQGICKALVNAAVEHVQDQVGNIVFVIEAENGSLAECIYQRFGFTKSEFLSAVCRYDHNHWKT